MRVDELKYHINNRESLHNVFVFKCKSRDSEFLFHQYVNRYCEDNGLEIRFTDNPYSFSNNSLFELDADNILYIYETSKLELIPNTNKHIWIKCTSITKKLLDEYSDIICELPKLEIWQIKDYIDTNLSIYNDDIKNKLFAHYRSDLFRLELELNKLSIFNYNIYDIIENQLYVDSTEHTIFDITNCLLKRDIITLNKLKNEISLIDIDPFGFIKVLLNNFKYVIDIQLARNPTPEYVGVSEKQFWAIKNHSCGFYSKDELVAIYKFLLGLDNKIKSGYINTDCIIDYVICKIMFL